MEEIFGEDINKKNVKTNSKAPTAPVEEIKKDEEYGYELYPERKGGKFKPSTFGWLWFGEGTRQISDNYRCEKNVYSCVQRSPIIKLMMRALRSSGCPIDIRRHISCEPCDISVSGGYDPQVNQIVVCQNVAASEGLVQGVLSHEMIHMFDYCRNNLDFKNIDHLACTEIRAANLTHCSYLSHMNQIGASFFKVKQAHQDCVKTKAMYSVKAVRNVDEKEAREAIDRVFDKCYADLEPIGRRMRRNSADMMRACNEAYLYGYV